MNQGNIIYIGKSKFDTTYPKTLGFRDLSGQIINGIHVLKYFGKCINAKTKSLYYTCKCPHCGREFIVNKNSIISAKVKSCGCKNRKGYEITSTSYPAANNFINHSGKTVNGINIIRYCGKTNSGHVIYECRCHCGRVFHAWIADILTGKTLSCGCMLKFNPKNSYRNKELSSKDNLYHIYKKVISIKSAYKNDYMTCDEWTDFEFGFIRFHDWAISSGYKSGMQILRKDIKMPYSPENCIFVDSKISVRYKDNNHLITINAYTYPLSIWAEIVGINFGSIQKRLRIGWSERDAVLTPIRGTPGVDVIDYIIPPEYEILNGCGQ